MDHSSTYAQYPQHQYPPPQHHQPTYSQTYGNHNYGQPGSMEQPKKKTGRISWLVRNTAALFKTKWPRAFFLVAIFQAMLCIAFEAYVFGKFQSSVKKQAQDDETGPVASQLKTIPTFLALFIFGFIYELVLVWDALLMKNTIQVIELCIANLALLVYTSIQIDQIREAITILVEGADLFDPDMWDEVRPLLVAIPCVITACTLVLGFIAWKLYQEFAWDILKYIGADYRMKKRFLHYQIYIALLKFDFFFFIGFTVQFLVIVSGIGNIEFYLTAAAIPVTIAILILAAWFTQKEWKWGMVVIIILYLGGLTYFIFKLSRIYDPTHEQSYRTVRRSLTAFAVLTIVLIVMTIVNAMVCTLNFGAGLKQHLQAGTRTEMSKDQVSYSLHDVKVSAVPGSRMTID